MPPRIAGLLQRLPVDLALALHCTPSDLVRLSVGNVGLGGLGNSGVRIYGVRNTAEYRIVRPPGLLAVLVDENQHIFDFNYLPEQVYTCAYLRRL